MPYVQKSIRAKIAQELKISELQASAAIDLLDQGATVPFIVHYRAASTAGLQDAQLRMLALRLSELRVLEERRAAILQVISAQESPADELVQAIRSAQTRGHLEALNSPAQKKKRVTPVPDAGLDVLAQCLLEDPNHAPEQQAEKFLNPAVGVNTIAQALAGARQILIEKFSENTLLIHQLRDYVWAQGVVHVTAAKNQLSGKKKKYHTAKYAAYLSYEQVISRISPDRALTLFQGRAEQILQLQLQLPVSKSDIDLRIARFFKILDLHPAGSTTFIWLMDTINLAIKTPLWSKLETDALAHLRDLADAHSTLLLSNALRAVLLVPALTPGITLGLEPAGRAGLNVVVIDATGKNLDAATIFPFAAQQEWHPALITLAKLVAKHKVQYISIGDAHGVRETERLIVDMLQMYPDFSVTYKRVSNVGAWASSVCTELGSTWRGAMSIARRMQDPLAELATIEAKALTVGQLQHDRQPARLAYFLAGIVEECVSKLGVDVNTASAHLLARVPGLNAALAHAIVQHRDINLAFDNRSQLLGVAGITPDIFKQAAGFLKIISGNNPLDAYRIHPEAYTLVERILANYHGDLPALLREAHQLEAAASVDEHISLLGVQDILYALEIADKDPRQVAVFKQPQRPVTVRKVHTKNINKPPVVERKAMPFNTSMADAFAKLKQDAL